MHRTEPPTVADFGSPDAVPATTPTRRDAHREPGGRAHGTARHAVAAAPSAGRRTATRATADTSRSDSTPRRPIVIATAPSGGPANRVLELARPEMPVVDVLVVEEAA